MTQIGLFPLELVLVPTEHVPLNIFEERYKELIRESIERDEEFGIVLMRGSGDMHHVGTRAAIAEVLEVLSDGRMHIVVEGGDRFRVLEVDHQRPVSLGADSQGIDRRFAPGDGARRPRAQPLPGRRRLPPPRGARRAPWSHLRAGRCRRGR